MRLWQRPFLETSTTKDIGRLAKGIEIIDERTVRPAQLLYSVGADRSVITGLPDPLPSPGRCQSPSASCVAHINHVG